MDKKSIIAPLLIIGLSIAFIGICFMVYLSKGKSKKWVARKMKIGAMVLSLSTISVVPQACCYKPAQGPYCRIEFDSKFETQNKVELQIDTENKLTGILMYSYTDKYSFSVQDTNSIIYQKGLIKPEDGDFDNSNENIFLTIDQNIKKGEYIISFFDTDSSNIEQFYPFESKKLFIK